MFFLVSFLQPPPPPQCHAMFMPSHKLPEPTTAIKATATTLRCYSDRSKLSTYNGSPAVTNKPKHTTEHMLRINVCNWLPLNSKVY